MQLVHSVDTHSWRPAFLSEHKALWQWQLIPPVIAAHTPTHTQTHKRRVWCLWQEKTTKHKIKSSINPQGKGKHQAGTSSKVKTETETKVIGSAGKHPTNRWVGGGCEGGQRGWAASTQTEIAKGAGPWEEISDRRNKKQGAIEKKMATTFLLPPSSWNVERVKELLTSWCAGEKDSFPSQRYDLFFIDRAGDNDSRGGFFLTFGWHPTHTDNQRRLFSLMRWSIFLFLGIHGLHKDWIEFLRQSIQQPNSSGATTAGGKRWKTRCLRECAAKKVMLTHSRVYWLMCFFNTFQQLQAVGPVFSFLWLFVCLFSTACCESLFFSNLSPEQAEIKGKT